MVWVYFWSPLGGLSFALLAPHLHLVELAVARLRCTYVSIQGFTYDTFISVLFSILLNE